MSNVATGVGEWRLKIAPWIEKSVQIDDKV